MAKNSVKIVMVSGSLTVDGMRHDIPPVDYERTETDDGKVSERGLPPGCAPGASVGEVLAAAFGGMKPASKTRRRKK